MDNPELGRKVLDHATAHPETFDMSTWGMVTDCGTGGCLAGHTMLQYGYGFDENACRFVRPDGSEVSGGYEGDEADGLLGLTEDERYSDNWQAWELFCASQTNHEALERFRSIVEASEAAKAATDA